MNYYSDRTDRQLFSDYRKSIEFLNDLIASYNKGSEMQFGEPIYKAIRSSKTEVILCERELELRNIPLTKIRNVPVKLQQLTRGQIQEFLDTREKLWDAQAKEQRAKELRVGSIVVSKSGNTKWLVTGRYNDTIETRYIYDYDGEQGQFTGETPHNYDAIKLIETAELT